jgi:hypothetical protein
VAQLPAFADQLAATGLEPYPGDAEQFRTLIKRDVESYGPLIRKLNLRAD